MRLRSVTANARRKRFEIQTSRQELIFPYAKGDPPPTARDPVKRVFVDEWLAREGFGYVLESGEEGSVHVDDVLAYNRKPDYLRHELLYKLTIEARQHVARSRLSRRELRRRLGTSASQLQRLLDVWNYKKSIDQLVSLLQILDCRVELTVTQTMGLVTPDPDSD